MGFIKKIMKLLQKGYNEIQALEVELRILEQTSAPPSRPRKSLFFVFLIILLRSNQSILVIYFSFIKLIAKYKT